MPVHNIGGHTVLVSTQRRALILRLKTPERVLAALPAARPFSHKGADLVAVPHRLDEVRVLRNLGLDAPSPILHHYEWSRDRVRIPQPFVAQTQTAAFLTLNARAYVLSGLGSGKTLSALWAWDYLMSVGEAGRLLIVSTLSTLERAWADAVFEHFPHRTWAVLHGTKARRLELLEQDHDIYIINHDGLKVIGDAFADRMDIDTVVVDEVSEAARNAQTDRWRALDRVVNKQPAAIKHPPRRCWGMTATPTPTAPTDAWAQCRLITPGSVPKYFGHFRDATMRAVTPYKWHAREDATETVFRAMQPAIRFSREECVDLPPTTWATREVPLSKQQETAYQQMMVRLMAEVGAGQIVAVNEAVKIGKLVQIACGGAYDEAGDVVGVDAGPRLDETLNIVREAEGKTIVFVPFVSGVAAVAEHLARAGISVGVVHGGVGNADRSEVFANFQRTAHPRVIVAQPAAMAHGLTLTAANTIVWYAPTNRPDIYEQANGRITRPGQTRNTLVVHIEGTPIERQMYERLRLKQSLQGLLLDRVVQSRKAQEAA